MNYSRSRTRKFLYQMLYAASFWKVNEENFRDSFFEWVFESNLDEEYLEKMYKMILEKETFFISLIKKFAPKFQVESMDLAYIIPIYIGACEILFIDYEQIPNKVSMNEAIEIAKVYWDDSSKKIVNWVLNNIINDLENIKKESLIFDYNNNNFKFLKNS